MNILLPHNIYTNLLFQALPESLQHTTGYKSASLLGKTLAENKSDIVLLPVTDLLQHREFFVSSKRGISFDGTLSNAYLYFQPELQHIKKIALSGDISGTEVLCAKILMKEMYDEETEVSIVTDWVNNPQATLLLSGDHNFEKDRFFSGLSMAEEMVELMSLPFVHYVFASLDEEKIKQFDTLTQGIELKIYETVEQEDWDFRLSPEAKEHFQANISHVVYEFDDQDKEGINQILRLPYFHNIVDGIIEVKYVD